MGVRDWFGRVLGAQPPPTPPPPATVTPPPPTSPRSTPPPAAPAAPPPQPPPASPVHASPLVTEFDALRADPGLPASVARDLDAARTDLLALDDSTHRPPDEIGPRALTAYALWLRGSRFKTATRVGWSLVRHLGAAPADGEQWTAAELGWLLTLAGRDGPATSAYDLAHWCRRVLPVVEALPGTDLPGVVPGLRDVALTLLAPHDYTADADQLVAGAARRVADLVQRAEPDRIPVDVLVPGDAYGEAAREQMLTDRAEAEVAADLAELRSYGDGNRPSRRWRSALAKARGTRPGLVATAQALLAPLPDLLRPSRTELDAGLRLGDLRIVRAAMWAVCDLDDAWVTPTLGAIGVGAGVGPGGRGATPRQAPLTATAVAALAGRAEHRPDQAAGAIAQLSRIQQRIGNKTLRKNVAAALDAAAQNAGLTTGQLVERSVPDLGLDATGHAEVAVGDHVAVLQLTGPANAATLTTTWRTPAGTTVKTVPAALKSDHAEALAELRATAKEAKTVAGTQRNRVEDLMAVERSWDGADWVDYYARHPIVGLTAHGLIWQVRTGDAEWRSGLPEPAPEGWRLRGLDDLVTPVDPEDEVRLWHPIRERLSDIQGWRARLTFAGIRQPFKQAFREIYLLTPAEEETGTYSNRFAAHVLRYPQAGALMRTRGWSATHLGYWDGGYDGQATRAVGEEGWRATFYYELVEREADAYGDVSLCSTDQVRFERPDPDGAERGALPLREVPPLVFSEAMRDVDLFVGVTSVAADPDWSDRGTERFAAYWNQASFGTLTESAEVRRDALARLLPRTAIADRVELGDRFLVVHGRLRDYRIHLGSGNILMSPADTYLCIVTARGGRGPKVFLPFEEDGRLSVIISKAFLLADDTAITDPSIVAQLRVGL